MTPGDGDRRFHAARTAAVVRAVTPAVVSTSKSYGPKL